MADDPKSDFLAAEEIKKILHGREKAEQERIVRWVSESLELSGGAVKPKPEHSHSGLHIPIGSTEETRKPDGQHNVKDIRSFVQEKKPKNDVQFVALAAYYYRFVAPPADRKDIITTADLQNAARLAPRAVFKAPSTTLNNAVQQGYMDSAGRGTYRLNAVGENLVSMTLPSAGANASGKTARATGRLSKKTRAKKLGRSRTG